MENSVHMHAGVEGSGSNCTNSGWTEHLTEQNRFRVEISFAIVFIPLTFNLSRNQIFHPDRNNHCYLTAKLLFSHRKYAVLLRSTLDIIWYIWLSSSLGNVLLFSTSDICQSFKYKYLFPILSNYLIIWGAWIPVLF